MADLLDDDLLLVQRGGLSYKFTGADLKVSVRPKPINPAPGDITATPNFVGGTGTQGDPFILTPATVLTPGDTEFSSQELLVVSGNAGDLVQFEDLSVGAGARFAQPIGTVGGNGQWTGRIRYIDTPASTATTVYTGDLKLGTAYFRWVVTQEANPPLVEDTSSTIAGVEQVTETLTMTPGTASGGVPPIVPSYRWERSGDGTNWSTIAGATAETYTLVVADFDQFVRGVTVATDSALQVLELPTPSTAKIIYPPLTELTPTTIDTETQVGQTVTAVAGTAQGGFGTITDGVSVRWQRSNTGTGNWGDIPGATGLTYVLAGVDANNYVRAVSVSQDSVTPTPQTLDLPSASSGVITTAPPLTQLTPSTVAGTAQIGQTLTMTAGTAQGGTPPIIYAYRWETSSNGTTGWTPIAGQTGLTYAIVPGDLGQYLRGVTIASDETLPINQTLELPTPASTQIIYPPLVEATPTTISGQAVVGQTLTAVAGTATGGTAPITYATRWQRSPNGTSSWADIAGATGLTYTLVTADGDNYVRAATLATDSSTPAAQQLDLFSASSGKILTTTVAKPSLLTPGDGATDVGEMPTLTTTAFSATGGLTHIKSNWQITLSTDTGFSAPVSESLDDTVNLVSWDGGPLQESTDYIARARHVGTGDILSDWSDVISFTTKDSFVLAAKPGRLYRNTSVTTTPTLTALTAPVLMNNVSSMINTTAPNNSSVVSVGIDGNLYTQTTLNVMGVCPKTGGLGDVISVVCEWYQGLAVLFDNGELKLWDQYISSVVIPTTVFNDVPTLTVTGVSDMGSCGTYSGAIWYAKTDGTVGYIESSIQTDLPLSLPANVKVKSIGSLSPGPLVDFLVLATNGDVYHVGSGGNTDLPAGGTLAAPQLLTIEAGVKFKELNSPYQVYNLNADVALCSRTGKIYFLRQGSGPTFTKWVTGEYASCPIGAWSETTIYAIQADGKYYIGDTSTNTSTDEPTNWTEIPNPQGSTLEGFGNASRATAINRNLRGGPVIIVPD